MNAKDDGIESQTNRKMSIFRFAAECYLKILNFEICSG